MIQVMQRIPDERDESGMRADGATDYTRIVADVMGSREEYGVKQHPSDIIAAMDWTERWPGRAGKKI